MSINIEHKDISVGEIHSPFQWEVLNVAELSTIVPEGVNDVRKVAFVVDDGTGNPTAYVLTQFTPAIEWKPLVNVVGGVGSVIWGGIGGTVANQTDLVAYLQANFYTQAQINSFMSGYYTKAEVDTIASGKEPANVNIQSHISSTSNPHSTTAAQVGAYTTAQTDTLLNGKIDESREGIANGIATLDTNAKINLSQIPDSILGQLEYQGVWDMTTLPTPTQKGHYWIASVAGNGYEVGDWAVYNGSTFDKVDNTDAVSSVAGRTGNIVLNKNDVGLSNVDNTSDLDKPVSTATQTALDGKVAKITSEDIEITDATKGVILKSANGTRYRITVDNDGSLTTTAI